MRTLLRNAIMSLLTLTLLTGIAYPMLVTGIAQLLFANAANGSVIMRGDKPVGSELIGQPFSDPRYFWGRPSATSPFAYNSAASSGSNVGPTNPAFTDAVKARIEALRAADPGNTQPVPVDLVTASGSGLDPHISPAAAAYQVGRVARARGMPVQDVEKLVAAATEGRFLKVMGEPRDTRCGKIQLMPKASRRLAFAALLAQLLLHSGKSLFFQPAPGSKAVIAGTIACVSGPRFFS